MSNSTDSRHYAIAKRAIVVFVLFLAVATITWIISGVSLFTAYPKLRSAPWKLNTTTPQARAASVNKNDPATSAWAYDFTGRPDGALSATDWVFEEGVKTAAYHNELQAYTSRTSNARIEHGLLIIEARQEALYGKQYTSARINTMDKFSFTYGTLEVDMMLPKGRGTWPAAWLMPRKNKYSAGAYGIANNDKLAWAMNGEIDFVEALGSLPGQNMPSAHSYNELHQKPTYTPAFISDSDTAFHRYGIVKTPESITFTLDGQPYASRHKTSDNPLDWPYDQPYYLIVNLAVGGDWAGQDGVDNSSAPWQLKVRTISYKPL
jgi:beta-glucanase (GH16 family)